MRFFKRLFRIKAKPKFEIGEAVKCVDDRKHIIEYGKEYKILDRNYCEKCDKRSYDVGLRQHGFTTCGSCGKEIAGKGIRWAGEFRFTPKQTDKARAKMDESISIKTKEILEKEIEHVGLS